MSSIEEEKNLTLTATAATKKSHKQKKSRSKKNKQTSAESKEETKAESKGESTVEGKEVAIAESAAENKDSVWNDESGNQEEWVVI